jgi:hypothetical protein
MAKKRVSNTKTASGPGKRKPTATGLLDRLAANELATVLHTLLQRHGELRSEAEEIAVAVASSPSVENIADDVFASVTGLDMDDLNGRAGAHSWGYVEPSEAAQELLEGAVEPQFQDMKRRMDLGLGPAAEAVCAGIVLGLYRARREKSGELLNWAPDFPAEHAGFVMEEYLDGYPAGKRRAACDSLAAALTKLVPEWSRMISEIAKQSRER